MRWRVYYDDEDLDYSDWDGPAWDAPGSGVQVIAQADPTVGRALVYGKDYYWWDPAAGCWLGGDRDGLLDYLSRPGPRKVLAGRTTTPWQHEAAYRRALLDPDLPEKTARYEGEPR